MSAVSEAARLSVVLADFASQDSSGKVGVLGAAWSHTTSPTPPQAVLVVVEVPGEQTNVHFALELTLEDQHGRPHLVPDALGGEGQPLRIAQNLMAVAVPGAPRSAPGVVPFVINMAPGLLLTPDANYSWRATVDGDRARSCATTFYVRAEQKGPVLG